jgi:hypothetical protein
MFALAMTLSYIPLALWALHEIRTPPINESRQYEKDTHI